MLNVVSIPRFLENKILAVKENHDKVVALYNTIHGKLDSLEPEDWLDYMVGVGLETPREVEYVSSLIARVYAAVRIAIWFEIDYAVVHLSDDEIIQFNHYIHEYDYEKEIAALESHIIEMDSNPTRFEASKDDTVAMLMGKARSLKEMARGLFAAKKD